MHAREQEINTAGQPGIYSTTRASKLLASYSYTCGTHHVQMHDRSPRGGAVVVLDLGDGAVVVVVVEAVGAAASTAVAVAVAEGARVVLERALVLELGAAQAVPEPAAVLLVRAPVALHGERLAALAAQERLQPVLALVVRLQRPEVLERPRPRVVDVVAAPRRAAVARQPEHRRRLHAAEGLRALAVLRTVAPHVHLPSSLSCIYTDLLVTN
jgi:hypothetical protein